MIAFRGETKNGNGSRSAPPVGYRCDCHKCRFHDQYPHLVGRPLTPTEFMAVNPVVNNHVPVDHGPEVAAAWVAVELAQEEFWAADKVWEQALREQSRSRLKRGYQAYQAMILHPTGNMIPNPSPKPPDDSDAADEAVAIAKDAREEAGEKLRLATSRHSGLLMVWGQRQRDAEHAERQAERDAAEQAEKARKRKWLFDRIGK